MSVNEMYNAFFKFYLRNNMKLLMLKNISTKFLFLQINYHACCIIEPFNSQE